MSKEHQLGDRNCYTGLTRSTDFQWQGDSSVMELAGSRCEDKPGAGNHGGYCWQLKPKVQVEYRMV